MASKLVLICAVHSISFAARNRHKEVIQRSKTGRLVFESPLFNSHESISPWSTGPSPTKPHADYSPHTGTASGQATSQTLPGGGQQTTASHRAHALARTSTKDKTTKTTATNQKIDGMRLRPPCAPNASFLRKAVLIRPCPAVNVYVIHLA